jgi:hypothetical protein
MGAGEVAGGVDHRHDHQPEDERDPDGAEDALVEGIGDNRATAGEDQGEGPDRLGGGTAQQVGTLAHETDEKTSRTASRAPGTRLK